MNYTKLLIFATIAISIIFNSCTQASNQGEWIQLFNGEDLTGWTPKIVGYEAGDNFGKTFRVEDGLIKVRYEEYDSLRNRFGHLFYKDEFSHYKLRVDIVSLAIKLQGHQAGHIEIVEL